MNDKPSHQTIDDMDDAMDDQPSHPTVDAMDDAMDDQLSHPTVDARDKPSCPVVDSDDDVLPRPVTNMQTLPANGGLSTVDIINILQHRVVVPILDKIPTGFKSNVYYVIDNTNNIERRKHGRKQIFHDDCGIWKACGARSATYP